MVRVELKALPSKNQLSCELFGNCSGLPCAAASTSSVYVPSKTGTTGKCLDIYESFGLVLGRSRASCTIWIERLASLETLSVS